jgi:hypothetical protein
MAREGVYGERKDGTGTEAEGAKRLEEKWQWRKEWLSSKSDPLLKADSTRST